MFGCHGKVRGKGKKTTKTMFGFQNVCKKEIEIKI